MSNLLNQNMWNQQPQYQMGGANFSPYINQSWQMPQQQQRLPVYSAQPIHGHDAAMQFPMAPNSEIYLPDANQDIIWWIRTDNMGNHLVQGFDIKLHQDPVPVDTNVASMLKGSSNGLQGIAQQMARERGIDLNMLIQKLQQ